jgi:nitronate monooxygenase
MVELLRKLHIEHPIIQAPMAGGPGTPELAAAVSNAGGLGSLAGGYLTANQIAAELERARQLTSRPLNVNLFAGGYESRSDHDPTPILRLLTTIHAELGLPPPELPKVGPDPLREQIAAVLYARPRVFSFTFGIPPAGLMLELRAKGIAMFGTATTVAEGEMLADADVDAIVAQGSEAGAHRGTFAGPFEAAMVPTLELVRQITARVRTPVIASGGIMTGAEIGKALDAGATAVQLGTAFLACPEAGTSAAYRAALRRSSGEDTVITRAYSGRPARGIRNRFVDLVGERDELILPFPIQNSLTRPMRAAATKAADPDYLSLWAGTGVSRLREMPAGLLVATLMRELMESG